MVVGQKHQVGAAITFLAMEERNKGLEEIGVEALKTETEEETVAEIRMEVREDIKEILEEAQEVESKVLEDRIKMYN